MIKAIINGVDNSEELAGLAKRSLKKKRTI
jgi:hypothetical protein